jgi:predicted transcriptional regulator
MENNRLKRIIIEAVRQILSEKEITDPELQTQIKEFAELSNQIDRITNELKKLKDKYDSIESILTPILDELAETNDKALEVEDILVTIKKKGFERTSYAYKEAFEWLKTKVNPALRAIVEEALEKTKKTSKIASSIAVQKTLSESKMTGIVSKLKGYWNSFLRVLNVNNKKLSNAINSFKEKA